LGIVDEEYAKGRRNRKKEMIKSLDDNLQAYRNWLLNITICDPACGSGAFLNQALEFLMDEHGYIDELESQLLRNAFEFPGVENHILEKNIFGVDINDESVDIAKLSLWLRTAQKGRKLTSLNNNIKCGNSLIDDPKIAGEKAFNWQKEFPSVFEEKEKKAFHITWVVHNSRTSQRMIDYKVKKGVAFWLEDEHEVVVAKTIKEIVEQDDLNAMALNICRDHVHFLLVCEEEELPNIVRKLKGKSSQKLKEHLQIPKEEQFTLWAQKYSTTYIKSEEQLWNTIEYIHNNRVKHELHSNKGLQTLVESDTMQQSYEHAFRTEHKGGFDVVIGNPPYVQSHSIDETTKKFIYENYETAEYQINTYAIFIEKLIDIICDNGRYSVIIPNYWLSTQYDSRLRKLIFLDNQCNEILNVFRVFEDATVDTVLLTGARDIEDRFPKITRVNSINKNLKTIQQRLSAIDGRMWASSLIIEFADANSETLISFDEKLNLKGKKVIGDYLEGYQGMKPYEKGKGIPTQTREMMQAKVYHSETKKDDTFFPLIGAANVQRFNLKKSKEYIKYGKNLAAPRKLEIFSGSRLLLNRILSKKKIDITYEDQTVINNTDVFNFIPKEGKEDLVKPLLAILGSVVCSKYFILSNVNLNRQAFPKLNVNNVLGFPVPDKLDEKKDVLSQFVDKIMSINGDLMKLKKSLLELLQSKCDIENPSKNLQNWHELGFGDFLKELKKAKVQLSLSEEAEWMHYFNEQKQQAQALKSEINRVDGEIDKMVYGLYGLSEEEIKIVEN